MAQDDQTTTASPGAADDLEKASLDTVYQKLDASAKGLTTGEAHERLKKSGKTGKKGKKCK